MQPSQMPSDANTAASGGDGGVVIGWDPFDRLRAGSRQQQPRTAGWDSPPYRRRRHGDRAPWLQGAAASSAQGISFELTGYRSGDIRFSIVIVDRRCSIGSWGRINAQRQTFNSQRSRIGRGGLAEPQSALAAHREVRPPNGPTHGDGALWLQREGPERGITTKRTQFCAGRRGNYFLESQKRSQLPRATAGWALRLHSGQASPPYREAGYRNVKLAACSPNHAALRASKQREAISGFPKPLNLPNEANFPGWL